MNPSLFSVSLIGALCLLASRSDLQATTFNIANGDVTALKTAINTSNTNNQDDTIELAAGGTYTLTVRDNQINGLPHISPDGGKKLTIHGNGATVQRSNAGGTLTFRIFYIDSGADATISNLSIVNGNIVAQGGSFGGAIYSDGESGAVALHISNCSFSQNSADYGGALYNDGESGSSSITATLTVANSTFTGNTSVNNGGAIFNDGAFGSASMSVANCTFSQNSSRDGGAIQHDAFTGSATGTVSNCTFSQNSASRDGGGVYIDGESGSAALSISSCTLSQNSALTTSGGGLYISTGAGGDASLQIGNTILKTGASGANFSNNTGTITSQGYNLSNDAAGGAAGTAPGGFLNHVGDKRNTDPLLDAAGLKANGGPTMTIAPQAGSPALDQGKRDTISLSSNDQRGVYRPFDDPNIGNASGGDGSDIGAYEADVHNTNEEKVGNDLRLTFTTSLGRNYQIQHATSLTGSWPTVLGTVPPPPIPGTGGIVQVTVPNAFSDPGANFYRVNELP
jgi:predicted outer membrane repeat protein